MTKISRNTPTTPSSVISAPSHPSEPNKLLEAHYKKLTSPSLKSRLKSNLANIPHDSTNKEIIRHYVMKEILMIELGEDIANSAEFSLMIASVTEQICADEAALSLLNMVIDELSNKP